MPDNRMKNEKGCPEGKDNAAKQRCHGRMLYFFFLAVITIFTTVNMVEFVRGTESDGRRLGLAQLDTVQDYAVTAWGGIQKALGKRLAFGATVYGDVTILANGTATMADQDAGTEAAISGAAMARDLAEEIGAEFLYVQAPGKELSKEEFPKGVEDYSIEKYDTVVKALGEKDIQVISMREVIKKDADKNGREWMDYFYRSDHHWQNNAAFLAANEISAYMDSKGMPVAAEALNEENYEKIRYENVFLGTHGRMAGPLYTGLDDYILWKPKFETDFVLDVPSQGIHKEGSFEGCFIHYENLEKYSYDYYAYYAYLKEDYDLFEIVNRMNPQGAHVVLVRDSEAVPVSVFLAMQCSELDILDLRYNSSLEPKRYIREKQPDLVLYLFGTGYLGNEGAMVLR